MRNNPRQYRPRQRKQGGGGLLSALASASMGAPSEANQMVPADIMATPAEPMPAGYEGPVNAPTPYTGPAMYYGADGQIVDQPFSDRRSWFDKFRGVPDSAGQANFQIQSQVAQQRALAPLELADAQRMMEATEAFTQKNQSNVLGRQQAENELKTKSELARLAALNTQGQDLGTTPIPNVGFNSKNPGDVDYRYAGDPSEILDQPFIPYGEGVAANSRIASNQLAQKQIESQIADRNEPKIVQFEGNLLSVSPDGFVTLLASGSQGKVVEGFDMTTGKPTSSVVGQSFKNFKPKPVANVYRGAGIQQPLEIDGAQIAQKYSGQTQNYVVGNDNTSVESSQGGAPKTPSKVSFPRVMPGRSSGGQLKGYGSELTPLEGEGQGNILQQILKWIKTPATNYRY